MSVHASKSNRLPDMAALRAELRPFSAAAVTSSTTETGVPVLKPGVLVGQADSGFTIEITAHVASVNTAGNNVHKLEIWSDTTDDASDDPETLLSVPVKTVGQLLLEIDALNVPEGHTYLGIRAVLSGSSSPSLDYAAHVTGSRPA